MPGRGEQRRSLREENEHLKAVVRDLQDEAFNQARRRDLERTTTLVAVDQMATTEFNRLTTIANTRLEMIYALGLLGKEIAVVDTMATYCTRSELPSAVSGRDEVLAALYTRTIGAARQANFHDWVLEILGQHVPARINGIQLVERDRGDELRRVVHEMSTEFSQRVEDILERTRQGRKVDHETERLIECAERFHVEDRTWEEARLLSIEHLVSGDERDRKLALRLKAESSAYFRNTYNANKRKLKTNQKYF